MMGENWVARWVAMTAGQLDHWMVVKLVERMVGYSVVHLADWKVEKTVDCLVD